MRFLGSNTDIDIQEMLNHYLPKIYHESKTVKEINKADAFELENIYMYINDILNQFFIPTATWGLKYWEQELGLTTNEKESIEIRRAKLYTKLQTSNVFTKAEALALAKRFSYSGIAEFFEMNNKNSFKTKFEVDDLIDYFLLKDSFNKVKPAHLYHLVCLGIYAETGLNVNSKTYQRIAVKLLSDNINTMVFNTYKNKITIKTGILVTSIHNVESLNDFSLNGVFYLNGDLYLDGVNTISETSYFNDTEKLTIKLYKNNQLIQTDIY